MTKDSEKMLYCLYGIFKEQNKIESRNGAKEISENRIKYKCTAFFNSEDICDLLSELKDYGYIKIDVLGYVYLQNSAIEKIENSSKESFDKIIDIISKLKP